jgi:1-acyl-sn-glycerol-3-phosphate acyltransferase
METIRYFFRYAIAILLMIPMYSLAILISIFNKPISWQIIVAWDRLFLKIFGVDVTLEFENPDIKDTPGGVIVGLNQGSLLDPIIGRSVSITIYKSIYNIEFALIPFLGWIAWIFGWVIIRQLPSHAKKSSRKQNYTFEKEGLYIFQLKERDQRTVN